MFWKKVSAISLTVLILAVVSGSIPILANEQTGPTATVESDFYQDNDQLKYPQVSDVKDEKMEEKINKQLLQYIKDSYKEYKQNEKMAKKYDFKADYQTEYEVKYNKAPKLSILTSNYIFSGGAHGNTTVQSFNYDVEEGKRVVLTDILKTEEQRKDVQEYVWEYAIERPDIFYPDLKKEDVKLHADTAFYYNDDGITLVFQQYEIAPYVSGNQEIKVPEDVYKEA
ncbi:DUF3298 and DUF4163 domain-containing protein [Gracilibacillus sp. YIM 98692]|uniref:DUF3298 and DUF4163 domain-containing protein n=1 Tax=Gracilibacillus sp. YIM 98692 TaxID=2663532 RepID=UPI0013D86532|nr:DUF3298 and DUF4163 domain-containing protein [Gracilibacillus sp. YIM 98692]